MTTTPEHTDRATAHPTTRRTVLAGAGVAGAAALLAACSSGASSPSSAPSTEPSANAGGGGGTPGGGQGQGGGTVLGPTSEVPVGGGKVYPAQQVVVTQPSAGSFKCFTAVCTHAGCTVGSVSGGTINCPCHGSRYHIADGTVANGPAPRALAEEKIDVSGGEITLA